ncbi:MAG TPA: MBL fold metallo-hydrolase [Rhizomicrobium sp.]|nr:MBL fold metallo-hydrolase [Rhizomicrobium sp.]
MTRSRWVAAILVLVLFVAPMTVWLLTLSPSFDLWAYRQMAISQLDHPAPVLAKDGELSVLLCGSGSPLPDYKRASACTLIAAGRDLYLVDSGPDSTRNLVFWRVPLERVKGVLLTHFHSDHIGELGELRLQTWVAGRREPLRVYGPPGVEDVVAGFNRAYSHDADYRTAHHGEAFLPREDVDMVAVPIPMSGATARVFDANGLKVTAIRVDHGPVKPAYGYRFDYDGRSITVSGDTAYYPPLAKAATGSDVLVHEAQSNAMIAILGSVMMQNGRPRPAKIMHDIRTYHTTPVEAARIANMANAKLLLYTHTIPPLPNWIAERAFLAGVSDVRHGDWMLGHDGTLIRLPGHSDTIEKTAIH